MDLSFIADYVSPIALVICLAIGYIIKNAIPNDPQSPFVTSGVRLGTAAVTSRGMKPEDMDKIAEAIAMTLKEEGSQEKAKAIVKELTDKYPLVG